MYVGVPDREWFGANELHEAYTGNRITSYNVCYTKLLRNENAEFIPTTGKGYRIDGRRHPHSWSILDAEDTANWIERMIKNE